MTLTLVTDSRRACPDARTDSALVTGATRWLADAIDAGIDRIQIREHALKTSTVCVLARAVVAAASGTSTQVLINNRADVARVSGAHGVHLRDDGWPAVRVRGLSALPWMIGRSVHADVADAAGVHDLDYLIFGAIFGSAGKPARGTAALQAVVASSPLPVVAIGGITAENAGECRSAGASGIAAISLFLPRGQAPGALGPRDAISRLRAASGFTYTVKDSERKTDR
jgi:thiamine-phosphate diphosphorylase